MRTYVIKPGEECYTFQAAILCGACGQAARDDITLAGAAPEDPDDEETYDSDDYPKGPYEAGEDETCDRMDECLSLPKEDPKP